ncbi:MAG TPA: hypothetical protein DCO75_03990 [Fibrobacteres bacterium]|nr:hypothetical protein [Fibrobacterota bacterium]
MKAPVANSRQKPVNITLIICIAIFAASALCAGMFWKLDRSIEKTSAKVMETFTKKTFASRKSSYEQEYFIVTYSINGKEYTKKTMRRNGFGSEYIPVFYYRQLPGLAWFYKKANANMVYCCTFMMLSLVVAGITWSNIQKKKKNAEEDSSKKRKHS